MRLSIRCKHCRTTWMQSEDDIHVEIDFYEEKIFFVCPHCKSENIMDIGNWKKKQEHSPLPRTRLSY